jgi:hypothetical protein
MQKLRFSLSFPTKTRFRAQNNLILLKESRQKGQLRQKTKINNSPQLTSRNNKLQTYKSNNSKNKTLKLHIFIRVTLQWVI